MVRILRVPSPGQFTVVDHESSLPTYDDASTTCDLLCWHCCHRFESRPIPLPLSYDSCRDTFRVMGAFCSLRCMIAYSRDQRVLLPGASGGTIGMSVFYFWKRWTGLSDPRKMERAPPRCLLKAFGGHLSLEEFRASGPASDIVVMPPKCILQEQVYHERQRSVSHTHVSSMWAPKLTQASAVGGSGETLKLKRKHQQAKSIGPVKVKKTILEQALGMS